MAQARCFDPQTVINSFIETTFQHLVERIAPGYFRLHGHIPDEESVAATEALAILCHLQDNRQIPPYRPASQVQQEAEQLFRNRLKWRIQTQAPRWRKMTSLSCPDNPGYELQDQHAGNQPERIAIVNDTIRWVSKTLRDDRWTPEEIALYFAYESKKLSLERYAAALGISTDATKQRASRTRKKLQQRFGQLAEPLYAILARLLRQRNALHDIMFRHV